ncbi:hypothetical protein [Chitinophaga sp. sic0106]|uniref:hypothetical protein n=1 Tax=Chitinophaga sp. sic0106 TaxID=2854785 RepID=UPI001C461A39|nr:hypothetical protein [Chitinophaga sp. sic0106]MBV7529016.1 hypothetical protein [Chitinophaga sp. sic0106]
MGTNYWFLSGVGYFLGISNKWTTGSPVLLRWKYDGITKVNISWNDGSNSGVIANNIPASLNYFNWVVPASLAGKNVIIKISDVSNPATFRDFQPASPVSGMPVSNTSKYYGGIYDGHATASTYVFQPIIIQAPMLNAEVEAGVSTVISWVGNTSDSIHFYYSLDSGATWVNINTGTRLSPTSYEWITPNVTSVSALIKLTVGDSLFISPRFNIRSKSLKIIPSRTTAQVGMVWPVKWSAASLDTVNIYKKVDSGNWILVANKVDANRGAYNTIVNGGIGTTFQFKVQDTAWNVADSTVPVIIQPEPVSVAQKYMGGSYDGAATRSNITLLLLKSPVGSEVLISGNTFNVTWASYNLEDSVKIELSLDSGYTWQMVDKAPALVGKYEWVIPSQIKNARVFPARTLGEINSNCMLRVATFESNDLLSATQKSFTIKTSENIPSLDVVKPASGDTLQTGVSYQIKWDAQNISTALLSIDISDDDGATWTTIALNTANTGAFDWQVPLKYGSTTGVNYAKSRIRIYATIDGTKLTAESAPFVWKQQVLTGIPEEVVRNRDMKIYPNPATDFIMVHAFFPEKQNLVITINDIAGRKIYERGYLNVKDSFHERVPLKGAAGMVYVTVSTPQGKLCTVPVMIAK